MTLLQDVIKSAPEIFIFLAMMIGTWLGRIRIRGFTIGATACTLVVAVILSQLGHFVIPAILRSILFGFFVFSIGYRSGPEFFASLSFRTLSQVALALVIGLVGLVIVLVFTYWLKLESGTAAGLAAGALTQTSMMGTALGALAQLGLPTEVMNQQQANVAAGYAVTYVLGYIVVLLFVPLVAPWLMGVNLKTEAAKLEAAMGGDYSGPAENLLYQKFQARAYKVTIAAGRRISSVEARIGRRAAIERVLRSGQPIEPAPETLLEAGDEVVVTGPSSAIVTVASAIGPEIEGEPLLRSVEGESFDVFVSKRELHGRTLKDIVDKLGDVTHGVFLRALKRHGEDVLITPNTRIYVGDVMTLVGTTASLQRVMPLVGQVLRSSDKTDIAFLVGGLAAGLLAGFLSVTVGPVVFTLGGGGGALIAGLFCGWLRSRRPTMGAFPPSAQQTLADLGLGGFVACIGLANGSAAIVAIQSYGATLLLAGLVVTLVPMIAGTLFAYHVLRMNPVVICGGLAGAMTVDAAVAGTCEVAESQTPVLGVAVPYAISNVVLTVLGPIIVTLTHVA